ncbi:methyl-accepting chemotaxis protein [Paenibacillus sonchi]|nr:methyl-accepting chemotaxis protein [Paenibacillus sonchi]
MRHLKVRHKMLLLATVFIIMLIGTGVVGIITAKHMATGSGKSFSQNLQPMFLITEIRGNNRAIESLLLESLITKNDGKSQEHTAAIGEYININNELVTQLKAISFSNKDVSKKINEYLSLLPDYRAQRDSIVQLAGKKLKNEGYQIFSGSVFSKSREIMVSLLEDTAKLLVQDARNHNESNQQDAQRSLTLIILLILAALVLSVGISILISRMITKPLKELQVLMKDAEAGDLTASAAYPSRDETGQLHRSFNAMLKSLRTTMQGVSESTGLLSASSQEMCASAEQAAQASQFIAESSGEIAAGTGVQAETVDRAAHSVQAMAEEIDAARQSTHEMSGLMEEAAASADHGAAAVEVILAQMKEIAEATGKSSLLITDLLTQIQSQTEEAVQSIVRDSQLVSRGLSQSGAVPQVFAEIQESIRTAARQTAELREAIGHVSREALTVSQAMEQASEASRKSAEDVQNLSRAGEEQVTAMGEMLMSSRYLAALAENLHMNLGRFKL